MRITALLAVAAACLLTAATALGSNTATATLSSHAPGARPVALTLSFRSELQCGRLMGGAVVVTLPRQLRVPSTIAASSVLVGTQPARSVAVTGHVLTVALPLPRGMTCDSIVLGVARLAFSRTAKLGNPKTAGTYSVTLRHGSETFAAALAIH